MDASRVGGLVFDDPAARIISFKLVLTRIADQGQLQGVAAGCVPLTQQVAAAAQHCS